MNAAGWSRGLEVTGGGTGVVSHAGLAPAGAAFGPDVAFEPDTRVAKRRQCIRNIVLKRLSSKALAFYVSYFFGPPRAAVHRESVSSLLGPRAQ